MARLVGSVSDEINKSKGIDTYHPKESCPRLGPLRRVAMFMWMCKGIHPFPCLDDQARPWQAVTIAPPVA